MLEQLETSNLKPFNAARQVADCPSNGERMERANATLDAYARTRSDAPGGDDADTYRDAIADLLHLAHSYGHDLRAIVADAVINFRDETGVR